MVVSLWAASFFVWFLNLAFGLWRAFHDLVEGKLWQAALGVINVAGVNAVLGWIIYTAISTSGDF